MGNLVDLLLEDHNNVKRLFGQIQTAAGKELESLFSELREELVRHEVAEEEIVRPLTKSSVPGGKQIADDRIEEESAAERLLKKMEKAEVGTPEWHQLLDELRLGVLTHAEHEEQLEFPQLATHVDQEKLEKRAEMFEKAKKTAPTHPHPSTPNTPGANMALGPVAAVFDRARDAVSSAMKEAS